MSASEEFLRLVDLRGDLECARETFEDLVEGEGDVDPEAADEALDEVVTAKRLYSLAVETYAETHDTPVLMVEVAVDEACDARAKHDRLMAAIEDTLREQR
jgi:hypothetical protein